MKILTAEFVKSSAKIGQCPEDGLAEFAFIGRSNVGKSSLINMLAGISSLAKTSSTPGKTRLINHYLINRTWYLVDLPGYGYASVSKSDKELFSKMISDYLSKREALLNTFVLIDSRLNPQTQDLKFIEWMGQAGLPFTLVFTKSDKLTKQQLQKNIKHYQSVLLEFWEELPPMVITSSKTKDGRMEILSSIQNLIKPQKKLNIV